MDQEAAGPYAEVRRRYEAHTQASKALHTEATHDLPGGETRTSTFFLPHPLFMERGEGPFLFDQDGNRYIDFLGNYTSMIHGHAHPQIVSAVARQMELGSAHGACTEAQNRLAGIIKARVPSIERIRFTNSGTEAVMQAVRTARAMTKRPHLVKMTGGYHGSWDAVMVGIKDGMITPGLSPAAAEETLLTAFNDGPAATRLLKAHGHQIAAVIVEPMLGSTGAIPAEQDFLKTLRDITKEVGALLIFDEIQTFRLASGGAQEIFGVRPDLTTLGKVIGGGLPVGAWGGRADAMDLYDPRKPGAVSHPGTFNGNALAMVAGAEAMELLSVPEIDRINDLGDRLRQGIENAAREAGEPVVATGMGSMAQIHFSSGPVTDYASAAAADKEKSAAMHLALINHGVFTSPTCRFAVSTPMDETHVEAAVSAVAGALDSMHVPSAV